MTNKELAEWFETSSNLIKILEQFNDENKQLNMASEFGRLTLAEYIIGKFRDKDNE